MTREWWRRNKDALWLSWLIFSVGVFGALTLFDLLGGKYFSALLTALITYVFFWKALQEVNNGRHRKSSTSPAGNAASGTGGTGFGATITSRAGSAVARISAYSPEGPCPGLGPYRESIIKQLAAELTHESLVLQALLLIEGQIQERGYAAGINESFVVTRQPPPTLVGGTWPTLSFHVMCGRDPAPLPTSKIEFGEIEAYRCWLVKDGHLFSLYTPVKWPYDEPLKSKIEDHYLTAGGGGIHAFKESHTAASYGYQYLMNYPDEAAVAVGTVRLFGEVIEHETGYRAEFARVGSIEHILMGTLFDNETVLAHGRIVRERYCRKTIRALDGK